MGGSKTSDGLRQPSHLLVLVHGILGSPNEWKNVERVLKKNVGPDILVFSSKCNTHLLSLQGIDVAGRRLADEVRAVVRMTPGLAKISFVGHSLGGLVARYAVAVLLEQPSDQTMANQQPPSSHEGLCNRECNITRVVESDVAQAIERGLPETAGAANESGSEAGDKNDAKARADPSPQRLTMAGLDPVNFITLASPHLGVRGNKQLPFLLGVQWFERFAPPLAPLIVGHTGRQLFLADGEASKPPLLVRMTYDCAEAPFISALRAFQLRIAYANAGCDHMVGWRTSSIRREEELPKLPKFSFLPRFQRVLNVEDCPAVPPPPDGRPYPPTGPAALALLQAQNALRVRRPREVVAAHIRSSSATVFASLPMGRGTLKRSFSKPNISFGKLRWLGRASTFTFGSTTTHKQHLDQPQSPREDSEEEPEEDSQFNDNNRQPINFDDTNGPHPPSTSPSNNSTPNPAESTPSSSSPSCFSSKEAAHRFLEEEMVTGLQQVPWRKIDASLREVLRPWYAHHNVHNWAVRTPHELANFAALLASASRSLDVPASDNHDGRIPGERSNGLDLEINLRQEVKANHQSITPTSS